ncbi:MAG: trehalase [Cytophagales bacterium]|nr:MAG: trehalase [Cytophagales bacterium]
MHLFYQYSRLLISIVLISTFLFSCKNNSKQETLTQVDSSLYKPKYSDRYKEIYDTIQSEFNSLKAKVDYMPKEFVSINEGFKHIMFYWDTYFMNRGLLRTDTLKRMAKNNTENMLFMVQKIGFVPNATMSWGMNRSQPPYLSMMIRDVYDASQNKDTAWLKQNFKLLKKEYAFWMNGDKAIEDHRTPVKGLLKWAHHCSKSEVLAFYDQIKDRFNFPKDTTEEVKIKMVEPYISEAATGWDFNPRFGNRCPDYWSVELNTNMYVYQKNFAYFVKELGLKGEPDWEAEAENTKALINKYLWNEERGLYMDYDYVNNKFSSVASLITFQPLFFNLASKEQAEKVVSNLKLFEYEWSVTVCENTNQKTIYQWDYPAVWAPIFTLCMVGLDNYGYKEDAKRIAYKYMDLIAKNFVNPMPLEVKNGNETLKRKFGRLYEKYHVVTGEIYDPEYPSMEMMDWTASAYMEAYQYVNK